ncbi:MAG: hypothetical protein AAF564_02260 [Bacteroidota bacterium]
MGKLEAVVEVLEADQKANRQHFFKFLRAFLRNPGSVGAIVPSAPELARAMVAGLDLQAGETLLELGPGTGAFTDKIRLMLPEGAAYLGIERELAFVELLQRRFPDMHFVNGSAEDASEIHQDSGLGEVRAIVSSLPFATLLADVRNNIIEDVEHLMTPQCVFRTFQYVHAFPLPSAVRFRRAMDDRFGPFHRSRAVLPNVPPAYVLTWQGR